MDITGGNLYIIQVSDPRQRLLIQAVPSKINLKRSPDISVVKIVGKNTYNYQFTGGETHLSLDLDFFADQADRQDVIAKCRWLESLAYTDGGSKPPQLVRLVFGTLYNKQVWCVRKVDYDLSLFAKNYGYLPQQAYCKVELSIDTPNNMSIQQVWNAQNLSNIQGIR